MHSIISQVDYMFGYTVIDWFNQQLSSQGMSCICAISKDGEQELALDPKFYFDSYCLINMFFTSLARILRECSTVHSLPALFFFL